MTQDVVSWAALAPALALLGALVNGLLGARLREPLPGIVASVAVGAGFVLSLVAFFAFAGRGEAVVVPLWDYLAVSGVELALGFHLDQLSLLMMLVITGVGALIHVYSIGYMHADSGFARYFAYLNLFVAAMLVLVMADSYLLMFVGWEGVGVCSYLLIAFWFKQGTNVDAARKAYIVNRIGDAGFLLAMFLMFRTFGTLDVAAVNAAVGAFAFGAGAITAIGLLLLVAATGKSAQIPLHVWLPDAMAGPTPVSALIHAATMVTAGVYLIARASPIFATSPEASAAVAWVGAATALIAAFVAFAQTDIKRVLAYSTISQLGFMFVAVGVGAYSVAVFHLVTHAFFKALLFLVAGSVIHALGGEQDVRRMGGLGTRMRITGTTALVGTLAIAGVPLLAGFFSKDAILVHTFSSTLVEDYGAYFLYAVLLVSAVMTAGYMFRWYYTVFCGAERLSKATGAAVHESPRVMTVPLVVLAVGSVLTGYLGLPAFAFPNWIEGWLAPVTAAVTFTHPALWIEWLLLLVSVLAAALGLGLGYWAYHLQKGAPAARLGVGRLAAFGRSGAGFDALYRNAVVGPTEGTAGALSIVDRDILDRGMASGVTAAGLLARVTTLWQSGFVRAYALAMLCGVVALVLVVVVAGVRA
ncbi:MAG: NADH-quinone oxidoreductase subunit L [Trueperaceae bacterium]|nr:NADH-quinone oxidoreductase subunit L [Trueperaceae bacterium]